MPRIEEIEKFAQVLNSLGNEPAIRAAKSETIEQVPQPGEEPDQEETGPLDSLPSEDEALPQDILDGLSALAGEPSGGENAPEAPETFEAVETPEEPAAALPGAEEPAEDLTAFAPTAMEPPAAEAPGSGGDLDFGSLFAEESEPNPIEDLETPSAQEQAPVEEPFAFPEGEPAGLQSDISQMEIVPEDVAEPAGPGEMPSAPEAGAESFEDFGSFSLDTPSAAETAETGGESVELPNLDDLSFGEPLEAPAPGPEPAPEPSPEEPAAEAPSELAGGFDLDTITGFEAPPAEPGAEAFEAPPPAPEPPAEPIAEETAGMESLGEEGLGDLNLDEFSLPESAGQFGAPVAPSRAPAREAPAREAPAREPPPRAVPRRPRPEMPVPEELTGAEGEIELTPEQFARLKKTLVGLPRNLKIAVQDLIGGGKVKGPDLAKLISLLITGASAQEIATLTGRITGRRIRIPAGYEKKTGVAFEAEQRTFAYAFRENIFPFVRVVVLTVLLGGMLGFLGYSYVYRPLSAYSNYRAGYAQIVNDRFALANERFTRAVDVWPMRSWFYRYAEGFAARRQYVLAEEKYDELLRRFANDRKGILDYARMESRQLADYEKADALLQRLLDIKMYDYDALLATGDNDMEWAERVPAKFESARLTYATLIERLGVRDDLLFRMLRYFIRTDNGEEVERLRLYYAKKPEIRIDAEAFAELGGYLVDHRRLDYAQDVLFRADTVRPGLAEVHYNLARYYRIVRSPADEKLALDETVRLLKPTDPLTRKRLTMEIDTHTRLGEYNYRTEEYIAAERELQRAVGLVEQNQKMRLIGKERLFGRPYAALGDIHYYIQGDLATAGAAYRNAIDNLYTDPELTYKIGYIQYVGRDYKGALASFAAAEDESAYPSGNEALAPIALAQSASPSESAPAEPAPSRTQVPANLLFALGDCFFQRGDFFAAQGYFLGLLDRLETRRAAIGTLHPLEKPQDRALLDNLVKVNNNLGVTMLRLSERTGDRKKRSEALVYLTAAAQIADSLARSPDSVQRSETRALPSLNMRGILYPVTGFVLQIFQTLPKDFQALSW